MTLIQTLKRHSLLTYFVLAFALTWACWIPLALSNAFASEGTAQPSRFLLLWPLGEIMPSLVGILLTALFSGKSGLGALFRRLGQVRVALTWYAVALLLVPVLLSVAIGVNTLLGGATIDSAYYTWSSVLTLLALSLLVANGLVPLTSLGIVNFLTFDLTVTAVAVLFTWVYNNTNGSLFLMVLFHAVATATTDLFLIPLNYVSAPFLPKYGTPLLFLLLLWVAVTLVVVRAGAARLSRNVAPAEAR